MAVPVVCSIARTPIGRFSGVFSPLTAMRLGSAAIAGALERCGLDPAHVDEVLFGHVLQAGQGQITSRQAAVGGGLPMTVPCTTINKVCLSGMSAIASAAANVRLGHHVRRRRGDGVDDQRPLRPSWGTSGASHG